MKIHLLRKTLLTSVITVLGISLFAQDEIILDPSTLVPADTGYYIGGTMKDEDGDGTPEFYNGCYDAYGDGSHNEAGVQQGYTYNRSMIMPDCWPKDAIDDHTAALIDHAEGYIELTKSKYPNTDSAVMGYIITPAVKDLVSLTLELSPDNTPQESRPVSWYLEYSKDNGVTWEETYIESNLATKEKKGEEWIYDADGYLEFDEMVRESESTPIVIRILSKPLTETYTPQRLKVHYIKLVATMATIGVNSIAVQPMSIKVLDRQIISENGRIEVYNILGSKVGSGKSVNVDRGIYIVKSESGEKQKVLVQ